MTAVANNVFTAAQFNTHVRDNLLQTAPGKATTAGRIFVTTAANTIEERPVNSATVVTAQSTTTGAGGSFVDLTTAGPAVTITTGTQALVWFSAQGRSNTTNAAFECSVAVSSATTVAASVDWGMYWDGVAADSYLSNSRVHLFTGLNAGSNVFTMKYKKSSAVSGQNSSFQNREIVVLPL
jgi:hypothetical protein